jgi:hypothetical protein
MYLCYEHKRIAICDASADAWNVFMDVKSGLVYVDVGKFSYNSSQKYWRKYILMQSKMELSEPLVRGKQMGTPGNLHF